MADPLSLTRQGRIEAYEATIARSRFRSLTSLIGTEEDLEFLGRSFMQQYMPTRLPPAEELLRVNEIRKGSGRPVRVPAHQLWRSTLKLGIEGVLTSGQRGPKGAQSGRPEVIRYLNMLWQGLSALHDEVQDAHRLGVWLPCAFAVSRVQRVKLMPVSTGISIDEVRAAAMQGPMPGANNQNPTPPTRTFEPESEEQADSVQIDIAWYDSTGQAWSDRLQGEVGERRSSVAHYAEVNDLSVIPPVLLKKRQGAVELIQAFYDVGQPDDDPAMGLTSDTLSQMVAAAQIGMDEFALSRAFGVAPQAVTQLLEEGRRRLAEGGGEELHRCGALKANGEPCEREVAVVNEVCWQHAAKE